MEILNQSGIYCIRNLVSGRIYVGSAAKIKARWAIHRCYLGKSIHHSKILQRSWNKHGENNFVFEVLEFVSDQTLLIEREQHWINILHAACPKRGFNVHPNARSPLGVKRSVETRAKVSASKRTGKHAEMLVARNRSAEQRAIASATMARTNKAAAGKKRRPYSEERLAKLKAVSMKKGGSRSLESRLKQSATMKAQKSYMRLRMNQRSVNLPTDEHKEQPNDEVVCIRTPSASPPTREPSNGPDYKNYSI